MRSAYSQVGCLVLLALVSCAPPARAGSVLLENFAYADPAEARKAWLPKDISPPVQAVPGGVTFPCPFDGEIDRVYWDRAVTLNLERYTSLELDLTCDRPEALRSLTIYFKSGEGWYVWGQPLRRAGRQSISLIKEQASAEGRPAGWHKIEAIRVSPWRGAPVGASLTLHALVAREDALLLVRATTSARDADERAVAEKLTRRLGGWLDDLGLPHGLISDDDVEAGRLRGARVAVLPYNAHPSSRMLAALKAFLETGGKLVVFYGAEPRLAALMGMKLGRYARTDVPGRWSSMTFVDSSARYLPARVFQESFNIMPAHPAARDAKVIAWWEDAAGRRTRDPAWVASPQGLWMTHILQNDDVRNKQEMLLGLLGRLDPALWQAAARHRLNTAGQVDSFPSLAAALEGIGRAAAGDGAVGKLLERAVALHQKMRALYDEGRFLEAVEAGRTLRQVLTEAYARVQSPRAGEFRGVWEHEGVGWYPGDWNRTCRLLAGAGLTAVFPNLLWGGLAHYPSRVLPESYSSRKLGDQAKACVEAAHRNGLEVHVWMVCWSLQNAPEDFRLRMKKEGRLQVTAAGATIPWLNPADPRNADLALAALRDLVARYPVDGIHLDYIRYPNGNSCFSPVSRREFEKDRGRRVDDWPRAAAPGGPLAAEYQRWRAGRITAFVRAVSREVRAVRPGLKVSAAVFSSYPESVASVGQDWGAWLQEGLVDFVCPMTYTSDAADFAARTQKHLALPGAKGRVLPGLGVTADECQLAADQAIEQIVAARRLGAPGFMLFDLSHTLREDILPYLRMGVTRGP
ncbi:MAG: family 10 glycosylhydrolase [Kiritimatiellae bacterium]|nr:family 10 glycosylhydrolase [Kiritimatiellia bacterium]